MAIPVDPLLAQEAAGRFWSKVEKRGADCWRWKGAHADGYPRFGLGKHNCLATRVLYAMLTGEDPAELVLCHSCDNRSCINPFHLFAGSAAFNMREAVMRGRTLRPATDRTLLSLQASRKVTDRIRHRLLACFRAAGISYGELAERSGMSKSQAHKLLTRRVLGYASLDAILRLAAVLDVDVAEEIKAAE